MAVMSDASALEAIARELVAANTKQAAQYKSGKTNLLGFFVGQMMKKTGGSPLEKSALDETTIDSSSGTLQISYSSSDSQFASLLSSPLFQSVVK